MRRTTRRPVLLALAAVCLTASPTVLTGCGSSTAAGERPPDGGRAQLVLQRYATDTSQIGVSAAVVRGSRLLFAGGTGSANKERNAPADADSVFLIASVSKAVTAVAVMQLVEEGKIGLDTDVNEYLSFRLINPKSPDTPITMRHLLTHTSGILDNHYNTIAFPGFYFVDAEPVLSLAEFSRGMLTPDGQFYASNTFLDAPAGTQGHYSNTGIALAACIVEAVAGEDFAAHCHRRIFQPLGMARTSWRLTSLPAEQLAMPYSPEGEPIGNYTFVDYPNGALRTSVADLSRFLRMILGDGSFEGTRILESRTVREMLRIQSPDTPGDGQDGQALVWNYDSGYRPPLLGHDGGEAGVAATLRYDPGTKAGVILFQNKALESEEQQGRAKETVQALIDLAKER